MRRTTWSVTVDLTWRRGTRANHELGELPSVHTLGVNGGDRRPAADDGDVVGDREHLVEFVRDEEHCQALALELAKVGEQFVDFLRDEDGRRLVENEDLGPAVEHLEDLHALPITDPEIGDEVVRLNLKSVLEGNAADLGAEARAPIPRSFSAPRTTFSAP